MSPSIQEELISKGLASGYGKEKGQQGKGHDRGFRKDGGDRGKYANPVQENEVGRIIKAIAGGSGTLKDILKPEIYALPVQSNGEKGWALAIAQDFRGAGKADEAIKSSQLRRVFGEIKSIQRRLSQEESFEKLKAEIWGIMPLVAYAYARGIVKRDFYNLMSTLINERRIKTAEDFECFVDFYEAIIAYFKVD
jgi:CRISPR type III-A-associated protein Csm2